MIATARNTLARLARSLPACALLAGVAVHPVHASGVLPLEIELHARSVAPGEPLRVGALAAEPLESLTGVFLDREMYMTRLSATAGRPERWVGWSMIALDTQPGPAALELRGTTASGRPVGGTLALRIVAKDFPEERLEVQTKYVEPPAEVRERLARERRRLAGIYDERRPTAATDHPFVRPVPGEPTSIFGTRRLYNGRPRSPHPGLDLRAATGTPVLASGPGLVALAGDLYYSGNTVIVDHGGGLFTIYAHLSRIGVDQGERVEAGRRLGLSGATGRVTGPHLHWGAKIGDAPFDPTALLDEALFGGSPAQ